MASTINKHVKLLMRQQMKQWYEEFFENASRKYDQESFTKGTLGECVFIEQKNKTHCEATESKQHNLLPFW